MTANMTAQEQAAGLADVDPFGQAFRPPTLEVALFGRHVEDGEGAELAGYGASVYATEDADTYAVTLWSETDAFDEPTPVYVRRDQLGPATPDQFGAGVLTAFHDWAGRNNVDRPVDQRTAAQIVQDGLARAQNGTIHEVYRHTPEIDDGEVLRPGEVDSGDDRCPWMVNVNGTVGECGARLIQNDSDGFRCVRGHSHQFGADYFDDAEIRGGAHIGVSGALTMDGRDAATLEDPREHVSSDLSHRTVGAGTSAVAPEVAAFADVRAAVRASTLPLGHPVRALAAGRIVYDAGEGMVLYGALIDADMPPEVAEAVSVHAEMIEAAHLAAIRAQDAAWEDAFRAAGGTSLNTWNEAASLAADAHAETNDARIKVGEQVAQLLRDRGHDVRFVDIDDRGRGYVQLQ